jgi:hypothetical protein
MLHSRFKLLLSVLASGLISLPSSHAATASDWKNYREGARKAAQANEIELALDQYDLAFKEAQGAFKGTDLRFLDTVAEAANFCIQLRRFDEARQMYQAALDRMPTAKGGEQSYKAAFLAQVGTTYLYARKLDLAEESFKAAVEYAEQKLGESSPLLAEALEGLASVHIERKQPAQALPILKRALNIASSTSFSPHFNGIQQQYRPGPSTAEYSIQNTIGILHLSQSNYVEAEKSFREALKTINRQRADTAINFIKANTASLFSNLAQAHRGQAEYREAEDALIKSISTSEKLEGSALALNRASKLLAEVHYEQNDQELDRLFARLTLKKAETNPENFLPYAEVMIQHYARKDWPRTVQLINKARNAAPKFSAKLSGLGAKLATERKDFDTAHTFLTECISQLEKNDGANSAGLVSPLKDLADLQASTGKTEQAEKSYAQLVAVSRAAFGPKDSRLANALDDQANFLEKTGKTKDAEQARAEANKVRTAALVR